MYLFQVQLLRGCTKSGALTSALFAAQSHDLYQQLCAVPGLTFIQKPADVIAHRQRAQV